MKSRTVREDLDQWLPLIGWLEQRKALELQPGTPAMTSILKPATDAARVAPDTAPVTSLSVERADEPRAALELNESRIDPAVPVARTEEPLRESGWWIRLQSKVMGALGRSGSQPVEPVVSE
jgi:hypothetical protein